MVVALLRHVAAVLLPLAAARAGPARAAAQQPNGSTCRHWATEPARCTLSTVWTSPTAEPGTNVHRQTNGPVISGGMPLGNGETTALVFPLAPVNNSNFSLVPAPFILQNSLSFFVSMTTAMASDTSPFKLGMISLVTDPPLFGAELHHFEQRLEMHTATLTVRASTSGGLTISARVFVDANSNTISTALNTSTPVQLTVRVQSVHPNSSFAYGGGFIDWMGHSVPERSSPDVFEGHSTAGAGRVVISHRNEDTDFPAAFNYTLRQQGLSKLIPLLQSSDHWRHRQFGLALSGTATAAAAPSDGLSGDSTARHPVAAAAVQLRRLNESALVSAHPSTLFEVTVSTHANVTSSREEWLAQLTAQHDATVGAAAREQDEAHSTYSTTAASRRREAAHTDWWAQFWNRSHIIATASEGADPAAVAAAQVVSQIYAATRYVQAIQTRTWVPIKFNGELFTATLPPETSSSGPSYRQWGANSWWQNTRLPYWSMAPAADFENFASIFEFYLQTLPFNSRRTQIYFNHTGIFYTETKTLFGSYSVSGYGNGGGKADRPLNLPVYREKCSAMNYDFGGDAGGPEVSMMILDHFEYTRNASALRRYFPIVSLTLDFFRQHYNNRTASGTMVIWPTQALEKYKCADTQKTAKGALWYPPNATNCITDDTPTVVALHVLLERVLRLPASAGLGITAFQLAEWRAFQQILPQVPVQHPGDTGDASAVSSTLPYGSYPINYNETVNRHGYETPEMFPVHPYRYFSVGREALGVRRPKTPALNCLHHAPGTPSVCKNAQVNFGWTQLPMNAALLGSASLAQKAVSDRAMGGSAEGYRFVGFAPHDQDYEPAADQFANLNSGLQWMLVQPADDGEGSAIVFAAWPCSWDVDFKLAAPHNTTIEGALKGGKVTKMVVTPLDQAPFVHVHACQS
jgi:hypothetical protein